jgi:hypothetical protein
MFPENILPFAPKGAPNVFAQSVGEIPDAGISMEQPQRGHNVLVPALIEKRAELLLEPHLTFGLRPGGEIGGEVPEETRRRHAVD